MLPAERPVGFVVSRARRVGGAVSRATLDRLVAEGLDRHEAIHAIGSVVATTVWDVLRREAPVDRDAMLRALADLRARDWHAEPATARSPAPLGGECAEEVCSLLGGGECGLVLPQLVQMEA